MENDFHRVHSFAALNRDRRICSYTSFTAAKRCLRFHLSPLSDIIRPECIHRTPPPPPPCGSIFVRDNVDTTFPRVILRDTRSTRYVQLVTQCSTSQIRAGRRALQITVILSPRIPGTLSSPRPGHTFEVHGAAFWLYQRTMLPCKIPLCPRPVVPFF